MSKPDVLVIGGGVVGAMCAYHLAKDGAGVAVVDAGRFGAACSHGNCGYVSPSHALPLTQPGVLGKTVWTAFRKSSPLYIKPRLSPALWRWMLAFARRCNTRDMLAAADALHAILSASRRLYDDLLADEHIECDWEEQGLLFVHADRGELDAYAATAAMLGERYALRADKLDADALLAREPSLKPGAAAGAWHFPGDAHLRPDLLMRGLRGALERMGVQIIEDTPVRGLARDGGTARTARTDAGGIEADCFVFATGAMTPALGRHLGVRVPIQPGKGYSITMRRPTHCPTVPMIFEHEHVAVTPWRSGYRVGSTMEFSGYDATLNPARLDNLRRGAAKYLRGGDAAEADPPGEEAAAESWYGWRPMTPDSLPIIDRSPIASNVLVAAGHNMLGISTAPATGRLVADLIAGRPPHISLAPYRAGRFKRFGL